MSERRAPYRTPKPDSALLAALLPDEKSVQRDIIKELRRRNYEVLVTGAAPKRVRCVGCGAWFTPRVGTSNSVGTQDLFVSHPDWEIPNWRGPGKLRFFIGLEVKRPAGKTLVGSRSRGRIRSEQRTLVDAGMSIIVDSVESALAAVEAVGRER